MKFNSKFLVMALVCLSAAPVSAINAGRLIVTKTAVVNAPLPRVWEAIKAARLSDPGHRHIVSHVGSEYQVQERFVGMPVIGTVNCFYSEREIAGRKVEYKLINSDKFLAFEGSWELVSCEGGKQTSVTLTSFADTGLQIPFAAKITKKSTTETVDKRLSELKCAAEHPAVVSL